MDRRYGRTNKYCCIDTIRPLTPTRTPKPQVFINVCKHPELSIPSLKKKLDENGTEIEGMNIPLSAGPARSGQDKSGAPCVIYDVIVNPQVIEDVFSDQTGRQRDFICQLAIQSIEQKNKVILDKRYKLPKVRYQGELTSQYIQDRRNAPTIQEMSSTSSPLPSTGKVKTNTTSSPHDPPPTELRPLPWELLWQRRGGELECVQPEEGGEAAGAHFSPPLTLPDDDVTHVVFSSRFDISTETINKDDVHVQISPFKMQVSQS